MTKYRVNITDRGAMPPRHRRALARAEDQLLREDCIFSRAVRKATGWYRVKVTKSEMRVQRTKGAPLEFIATPKRMSEVIGLHDAGKAIPTISVQLDDELLAPVPGVAGKSRPERRVTGRHDLNRNGQPKNEKTGERKPRPPRGRYHYSREGFTRPLVTK